MLSTLFGKKSEHPLADMRSAQKLLEELPKNDTHKLLMDFAELIESVAEDNSLKVDQQFAMLRLFDEAAQPYIRKLTAEYFVPGELNSFQEGRLWLVLGNLSRQTAIAYYVVFKRYRNDEKGSSAIKPLAALLMARAVYAMIWQLKYVCVRYDLVEYATWENLAHIYASAEQQQCLDTPVNLYPGMVAKTSVRCETGHLLGWYGSGVSSLTPVHLHLTERLLAQYCLDIEVQARQSQSSLYSFDLHGPGAPLRVKMHSAAPLSMRFVGMPAMLPKLEQLLKTLEKNIVPDGLFLGGSYGAEVVKEAVIHLLSYLTNPPVRRSARRAIKISFNVANSFAEVMERIKARLSFSKERPSWQIQDISANGFLTVLPDQGGEGVRIGSLIGMQLEGVPHWGVAVVRRMLRNSAYQLHIGAEILSTQAADVALSQSGAGGGFDDGQDALWLFAKPNEATGEAKLLMKAGAFTAQRSLQTHFNQKKYLLIPIGLQEKYVDCDLARSRLIEQEDGQED